MLFNSFEFIFVFLPLTLSIYYLFCHNNYTKAAIGFLIVASLFFYAYWDICYLPLLILSIIFNYFMGRAITCNPSKRNLTIGISINLAVLMIFKYSGFLARTINDLAGFNLVVVPEIVLPLGISFFTFTQTAYLIDAYRGETAKYNFLTYALFVTIFPHLIAGPILDNKSIIPQFLDKQNFKFCSKNFAIGVLLFSIGLFKKVIIADTLSPWVELTFSHADQVTFLEAWVGALAYTLQIYFDFSGYSEMALGLGKMLNFSLPINFDSPYKSISIIEFWRRWHITLSNFLKNYLYIPLGGNRHGEIKRFRNLLLTMLMGGLWHGAGWTYIVWGGLHGTYLAINHLWRKYSLFKIPKTLSWAITFLAVVVAWVFFRASSTHDALLILKAMIGGNGVMLSYKSELSLGFLKQFGIIFGDSKYPDHTTDKLLAIVIGMVMLLKMKNAQRYVALFKPNIKWAIIVVALLIISIGYLTDVSEFIYFQF